MSVRVRCAREADHEWEHVDDDEDAEGPFAVLECQRCGRIRKKAVMTRDSMGATVLWIMQAYTHGWFGYTSGPTAIEARLLAHHRAGLVPISDVMKWAITQRRGRWSR